MPPPLPRLVRLDGELLIFDDLGLVVLPLVAGLIAVDARLAEDLAVDGGLLRAAGALRRRSLLDLATSRDELEELDFAGEGDTAAESSSEAVLKGEVGC